MLPIIYSLSKVTMKHPSWSGDGNVIKFDFGDTSGIRRVTIALDNFGSNYNANDIGFGVDNLEFKIGCQPVPEPARMLILGSGLVGLGAIKGRLARR
jgi:hypothetical protein